MVLILVAVRVRVQRHIMRQVVLVSLWSYVVGSVLFSTLPSSENESKGVRTCRITFQHTNNTWSHMVLAEALRFLLHKFFINPRTSANPNKELTLENVLRNPNMAEVFLNQMLQDPNNVQPNGDCVICMEETGKANRETGSIELQLRLRCSHVIGSGCLLTWLKEHNSCPMCRREVFPPKPRLHPHLVWLDSESDIGSESDSDSDFDEDFDEEQSSDEEESNDEEQNHAESDAAFGNSRAQDRENLEEIASDDAPDDVSEQDQEVFEEAVSNPVRDDVPNDILEQYQETLEERVSNDAPDDVLGQEQELLDGTVANDTLDDALGHNEEILDAVVAYETPENAVDMDLDIEEEDKLEIAEEQDSDSGEEDELDIAEDEDLDSGEEDELEIAEDEDLDSDEEDEFGIAEDEDTDSGEE